MSTQKGNQKKHPQKYQNKIAYKVKYNETYQKVSDNAPMDHLCQTCRNQIQWKIQYGKYKRPSNISRCAKCEQKSVFKAYRKICDPCSDELNVCAKCIDIVEEGEFQIEEDHLNQSEQKEMDSTLKGLRERCKRMIVRKLETGEIRWCKDKQCFVDSETDNQVEGLKFKKKYLDEEDEELWDDCEENDDSDEENDEDEEDEQQEILQNKIIQKPPQQVIIQEEQKNYQEKTYLQQQKQFYNQQSSDDSNDEHLYCRDIMSDESRDLDKWNRTQKNFRYYFNIKYYPNDDEPPSDEDNI